MTGHTDCHAGKTYVVDMKSGKRKIRAKDNQEPR